MNLPDSSEKWMLRVIVLASVIAAVAANHFWPDWGRTVLVTTVMFGSLTIVWHKYWCYWWFWITISSLFLVHSFFLSRIQPLLNSQNVFGFFALAAAEAIAVIGIMCFPVSWFYDDSPERKK